MAETLKYGMVGGDLLVSATEKHLRWTREQSWYADASPQLMN